jgi:hypothetical protein
VRGARRRENLGPCSEEDLALWGAGIHDGEIGLYAHATDFGDGHCDGMVV